MSSSINRQYEVILDAEVAEQQAEVDQTPVIVLVVSSYFPNALASSFVRCEVYDAG